MRSEGYFSWNTVEFSFSLRNPWPRGWCAHSCWLESLCLYSDKVIRILPTLAPLVFPFFCSKLATPGFFCLDFFCTRNIMIHLVSIFSLVSHHPIMTLKLASLSFGFWILLLLCFDLLWSTCITCGLVASVLGRQTALLPLFYREAVAGGQTLAVYVCLTAYVSQCDHQLFEGKYTVLTFLPSFLPVSLDTHWVSTGMQQAQEGSKWTRHRPPSRSSQSSRRERCDGMWVAWSATGGSGVLELGHPTREWGDVWKPILE